MLTLVIDFDFSLKRFINSADTEIDLKFNFTCAKIRHQLSFFLLTFKHFEVYILNKTVNLILTFELWNIILWLRKTVTYSLISTYFQLQDLWNLQNLIFPCF